MAAFSLLPIQLFVVPEDPVAERLPSLTCEVFLDALLALYSVFQSEDVCILPTFLQSSHPLRKSKLKTRNDLWMKSLNNLMRTLTLSNE